MRILWILLLVLAGSAAGYLLTRFEGDAPVIHTRVDGIDVGERHTHALRVSDEGMGLERVHVWLERNGETWALADESYPGDLFQGAEVGVERSLEVALEPAKLGIADGEATLVAEARDWAWRANVTRVEIPVRVDTRAPRVSLLTGLTYANRGGSELAVYRVDEKTSRDGIEVGEAFFPGYPHPADPGRRIVLYALPAASAHARPRVVAADLAGNASAVGLNVHITERTFPSDRVRLSRPFMETKYGELVGGEAPDDIVGGYLRINRDMRAENAATIREICGQSNPDRLWHGSFLQLPGSDVRSRFGENRTYLFDGRNVDQQIHLGFDLASTSGATVPAANGGVVVFADDLGIYGNTVILDHGLGLFSLYGHLSQISVAKGTQVGRGEPLGRTGQTGLAGGDHLHFSMLVGGVFVDPIEWFDEKWIREHIEPKLGVDAGPES